MNNRNETERGWREISAPFQEKYREYDDWFVDNPIFDLEVASVKALKTKIESPVLEVGIGPGRFARSLGVGFGIDPALQPLTLARERGALVCQAIGEQLPFRATTFGSVYLLFSLCFLAEPAAALRECRRILKPAGHLLIGLVPSLSPWGRILSQKGADGHPFYRRARLMTVAETQNLLRENGFTLVESVSALYALPESPPPVADHRPGADEQAGFAVLVAELG